MIGTAQDWRLWEAGQEGTVCWWVADPKPLNRAARATVRGQRKHAAM